MHPIQPFLPSGSPIRILSHFAESLRPLAVPATCDFVYAISFPGISLHPPTQQTLRTIQAERPLFTQTPVVSRLTQLINKQGARAITNASKRPFENRGSQQMR